MKTKLTAVLFGSLVFLACFGFMIPVSAKEPEEISYMVSFVDAQDYNQKIFNVQSGTGQEGTEVSVTFPNQIVGKDGYIWQAVLKSPQSFPLYHSGTHKFYVEYCRGDEIDEPEEEDEEKKRLENWLYKAWIGECAITGQNPEATQGSPRVVTNTAENNSLIRNLVSMVSDGEWHYFYVIGKNYIPQTLLIGTEFEAAYSSAIEDSFSFQGEQYYVLKAGVKRSRNPESCNHQWVEASRTEEGCITNGSGAWKCQRCEREEWCVYPAQGHSDENGDSLCDRCRKRRRQQAVGDRLVTALRTGADLREVTFTCLDADYKGTGKMLYLSDQVLKSDVTGICFDENNSYELSPLRQYFNREFLNNSSIGDAFQPINYIADTEAADIAALLSKEEYETYRASGHLKNANDDFLLRTPDMEGDPGTHIFAVDRDGNVKSVPAAGNVSCGARPFVLLDKPETEELAETELWKVGDVQIRKVGKKIYSFTCIDENYSDSLDGYRKAALFLCDQVIRSDIDSDKFHMQSFSFGKDNNYKTSDVRRWLEVNSRDADFSMEPIYIGVNTAYTGSTAKGSLEQLEARSLTAHNIGFQLLNERLFCLSLAEGLKYRTLLWKFNGADRDNPESQISPYSCGYYLRTPFYEEAKDGSFRYSQNIYGVDLINGNIHTVGTDANTYGLRPAFALSQGQGQ